MYEICKHVNFMFQFGIIIDYLFTFEKFLFFFSKIPSFWVFTQASGKYLGKYPKNIYLPTGYLPTPHHYTHAQIHHRKNSKNAFKILMILVSFYLIKINLKVPNEQKSFCKMDNLISMRIQFHIQCSELFIPRVPTSFQFFQVKY